MPRKEDIAKYLADKRRYAGEKVPSMTRRRLGHDYEARRMYFITVTVEGRRPLLGHLAGDPQVPHGAEGAPHIVLSPLGRAVEGRMLTLAPWERTTSGAPYGATNASHSMIWRRCSVGEGSGTGIVVVTGVGMAM